MRTRYAKCRKASGGYKWKWALLKPHFDGVKVTDVDTKFLLSLRETLSQKKTQTGGLVKPATLKKDLDFVRLVLATPSTSTNASTSCRNFRPSAATPGKSFRRRARSSTMNSGSRCASWARHASARPTLIRARNVSDRSSIGSCSSPSVPPCVSAKRIVCAGAIAR